MMKIHHLKRILSILEKHDMHVHEIVNEIPLPVHIVPVIDTHYVMKKGDIVHVGTPKSIHGFALSMEAK